MKKTSKIKEVLLSVLTIAVFVLLAPVVSSAQTGDLIAPAPAPAPKPAPATTDSSTVTSVGFNAGVTSLASDANGNVYASLQYTNKVVKLNGSGTVIGSFETGANPTGLVVDDANGVLWVMNNSADTVTKMGLDGTLIATYKAGGEGPVFAALSGSMLYIACERSNTLVLMTTSGVVTASIAVASRPVWVSVDSGLYSKSGGSVYVACNKANAVMKLSPTGEVLAKYATPRGPYGMTLNSNGELFVACFWDALVVRISSTGATLSKTSVGDGAAGMLAYGNVVAVISNGTNTITRMSAADGSVISTDKVDRAPLIGTATVSGLWIACTGSGTIAKRAL